MVRQPEFWLQSTATAPYDLEFCPSRALPGCTHCESRAVGPCQVSAQLTGTAAGRVVGAGTRTRRKYGSLAEYWHAARSPPYPHPRNRAHVFTRPRNRAHCTQRTALASPRQPRQHSARIRDSAVPLFLRALWH